MIRISRVGLFAAVLAAGIATRTSAQVVHDPCFYRRDECDARARDAEVRAQRLADDRWTREQEARLRADLQRDRSRDVARDQQVRIREQQQRTVEQQERMREQQDRMRERMIERAQENRQRDLERAQERRAHDMERAQEMRDREMERAQEMRDRLFERTREQRASDTQRVQIREPRVDGRDYIAPPPGVRIRSRWP